MASNNNPWPLREAHALLKSLEGRPVDGPVVLETGYGPSGLPHIGTFAEVARTTFIRRAFRQLSDRPTELVAFSDDMDGLRKVPLNVPRREVIAAHLGKPLSSIPDPFEEDASFSDHMNRRLREFLTSFGFETSFRSSTECYGSGRFNEGLQLLLERVDAVLSIILPTLRSDSREGWSPFMVICPGCGRNLSTRVSAYHPERSSVSFVCDRATAEIPACGEGGEVSILDGHAKVGWKVDWALRWFTFGVHYEMYGKDLIESAQISKRIVKALGGTPPIGLFYEMFLDEDGKKISKSVGKGISVDGWQDYAPIESLLAFLYQNPRKAKRLHYDVIPQFTDQYLKQLSDWEEQDEEARRWNPSYFYFDPDGSRPRWQVGVNYSLVRNLVACMGKDDPEVVAGYLGRYDARIDEPDHRTLAAELVRGAIAYDREFEAPNRTLAPPPAEFVPAIRTLVAALRAQGDEEAEAEAEAVQGLVFDAARAHSIEAKDLFRTLYRGLIGQNRGPRFGSFALAMGLHEAADALDHLADESSTP